MHEIKLNELKKQSNMMREALRELRTNIRFCGDDIKTILFTSVMPNEGKSTVVMNLARSLVDAGNRVLVIDSDMRKSVLVGRHKAKRTDGGLVHGLSHLLSGQMDLDEVIYQTQFPQLYMIFAGPAVVNPTELLENQYYPKLINAVRGRFDYVLIDCAPLGAAIDAAVIAKECDGAIIVISQGEVSSKAAVGVKRQLEASGVRILGAVINKVNVKKSKYYGRYYGGYYGKYYGTEDNAVPKADISGEVKMRSDLEEIRRASSALERENAIAQHIALQKVALEKVSQKHVGQPVGQRAEQAVVPDRDQVQGQSAPQVRSWQQERRREE
ncbi:MAG: polysaccharide biosynthesis tyrosine autokinase [Lachnospiraceae bacterium]|nr:polysaccharide biosynthesis tyrosine autokinase [Lachnospiraceae bacterium]